MFAGSPLLAFPAPDVQRAIIEGAQPAGLNQQRLINKKKQLAVRVGFEPTLEFPLNTLSKRAPSTTRPPHLNRFEGVASDGRRVI